MITSHRLRSLNRHIIITACLALTSLFILNSKYQAQAEGPIKPATPATVGQPTMSVVRVTNNSARDFQPAWSPDGSTIVFGSDRIAGSNQLDVYEIKPDGSNERLLAQVTAGGDGRFFGPSWLGTSRDLLVIDRNIFWEMLRIRLADAAQNNSIPISRNTMDGDSSFITRLMFVPGGQGASSPITSPDGLKLAWAALIDSHTLPDDQQRYEVRVFNGGLSSFIGNTDTAGSSVFRTEPGGQIGEGSGDVAFSPDGKKVCIAACPSGWLAGKRRDLFVIDLGTGDRQRLTTSGEQGRDNLYITWSSQNRIAFSSRASDSGNYDLYTIRPDGTGLLRLTDSPANEITPSWNPDGSRLAYASDESGNYELYITDVGAATPTPRSSLIFIPGVAGSRLEHPSSPINPLWPGIGVVGSLLALDPDGGGLRLNATDAIRLIDLPAIDDIHVYDGMMGRLTSTAADGGGYTEYRVGGRRGDPCIDPPDLNANLYVFPYDWRRDNAEAASALNNFITCVLDDHPGEGGKVDILTHSMGGLVAARYLSEPQAGHRVGRLVTVAAPWLGAPKAIDVLETGGFMEGTWERLLSRGVFKDLSRNYRSVHQLLPTEKYFDLGGRPLIRKKLFGTDVAIEDYDEFVRIMDERFIGSHPGTNGKSFHDNLPQDDGSRLPADIKYYHFYGSSGRKDTVTAVKIPPTCISIGVPLGPSVTRCFTQYEKASGDGTVPELSAKRSTALNPPNASVCKFEDTVNSSVVNHTNLSHHYSVLTSALRAFRSDTQISCAALFGTSSSPRSAQEVSQAAYYLTLVGARSIIVSDPVGSSTEALSDPSDAGLPNVMTIRTGDASADLIIPISQPYTVTFRADGPMFVQVTRETDAPDTAIRYQDLMLPAGATARLRLTPQGIEDIFYDANGDGVFETATAPTVSLSGNAANDLTPPSVSFTSSLQGGNLSVSISAIDAGSGVKAIQYSLDGVQYKSYAGPLNVSPHAGVIVRAYAEDNAANRSEIFTFYPSSTGNAIDNTHFFVKQHYLDFLNREPDASGLQFWANEITSCEENTQCQEVKRINVSAAFYLSIEFQQTGYLSYRAHKAAFGNIQGKPVPITREQMLTDMQQLGRNVVVGQGDWEERLEQNKRAYFDAVVTTSRFTSLYPQSMTPEQYVDALDQNAGSVLSASERAGLVNDLKNNAKTRAQVLRAMTEDADLDRAEFNRAFVLMQYFGYLRRDPDSAPDSDFSGFNFWLGKLNEFKGNFIQAEMVKAFLDSIEYKRRFGQ